MTIATVLAALVTTEETVDGLAKAYPYPPASLQRVNLPCAINLPTNARHSKIADGYKVEERDYLIMVACVRRSEKKPDEIFQFAGGILDPFINALEGAPKLGGGDSEVQQAIVTSDTGIVTFEYEGSSERYVGFEVTLAVTSKRVVTVAGA